MRFKTTVAGEKCFCNVLHHYAGTNYTIHSASLEPNDPEEFEFELEYEDGKHAPELEEKLTWNDESRLLDEFKRTCRDCISRY